MKISLLVDFENFWNSLRQDLSAAKDSVYVQTFSFEADHIGNLLAEALTDSRARDKRILADSFSRIVVSDKFLYSPSNWFDRELKAEVRATRNGALILCASGVAVKHCNPLGPTPRHLLNRNHKKLIVVDGHIAYIGGLNFSEHNAKWHDMMLRIEDTAVAKFLSEDFVDCWEGRSTSRSETFAGNKFYSVNGRANRNAFAHVLRLIHSARESIFVASPYISFPFYDYLKNARRRGVDVTVLTPQKNNWKFFGDYARWEALRCDLNLRLYSEGMSHLKAMLIDDRYLIAGSSNFDILSYRLYEEIVAIFSDEDVIAQFRERVMIPDLAASLGVEEQFNGTRSVWDTVRVKAFNTGLSVLMSSFSPPFGRG